MAELSESLQDFKGALSRTTDEKINQLWLAIMKNSLKGEIVSEHGAQFATIVYEEAKKRKLVVEH